MTYDINWYAQNAGILALILETIKRSGGHGLREMSPKIEQYYPQIVKAVGVCLAVLVCFVSKADALQTLEIEGFRAEFGYLVGGVLIFGGNTLIDAAWDQRKSIAEIAKTVRSKPTNPPPVENGSG